MSSKRAGANPTHHDSSVIKSGDFGQILKRDGRPQPQKGFYHLPINVNEGKHAKIGVRDTHRITDCAEHRDQT